MSDKRMAKATLPPRRRLTPRHVDTLRVALRLLRDTHHSSTLLYDARRDEQVEEILSDDAIDRLIDELASAAEVSVCRART